MSFHSKYEIHTNSNLTNSDLILVLTKRLNAFLQRTSSLDFVSHLIRIGLLCVSTAHLNNVV